ncbi:MAG: hypothetical protein H6R18_3019 [Proteobacteria bacterium]|nr:hypothetical protein [Pseudomonadota bacterium]
MEAPLNRLRELLGFDLAGDSRSQAHNPQDILDGLGGLPAPVALQQLHEQYLLAVNAVRNRLERFNLLEKAQPEIENCLPVLERIVSDAILPLPAKIRAIALIADNCLKGFTNAYSSIVSHVSGSRLDAAQAELLQHAIYRAIQALFRRQILAYRAYAIPSPSSWQHLHDLYQIARGHGVANRGDDKNIEKIYLCALLMAYADPSKIPRHNLDALRQSIDFLVPFAGIVSVSDFNPSHASLMGRFLVNSETGSPGLPLARAGIHSKDPGNYIIECRGIINALDRKLAQSLDAQHHIPENVLVALRTAMEGQWTRRFARLRFKPKAHLIAGMGNALSLISAINEDKSLDEAMSSTSDWDILNESPDGFGLRFRNGLRWQVQAGDLVVLRIPDEKRLHICLVRRISNRQSNKFDLGLQELSPYASIIQLPAPEGQASRQGIFLPNLPAYDRSAGLLIRSGTFSTSAVFRAAGSDGVSRLWRCTEHVENNGQVEFHVLKPAESVT